MGLRAAVYRKFYLGKELERIERAMDEAKAHTPARGAELLRDMLSYVQQHVPYYRDLCAGAPRGALQEFPLLNKGIIRADPARFLSDETAPSRLITASTGGSTGEPLTLKYDEHAKLWMRIAEDYYFREFFGFDQDEVPTVVFWSNFLELFGRRRNFRKHLQLWLTQTRLYGSTYVAPHYLARFVEGINEVKPYAIKGYANTVYQTALYAREHNIRMHRPNFIFTTAERLQPFIRETVEEVFGCPLYDMYGCREFGMLAGQCRSGRMHLFSFGTHAELLDAAGEPAKPGTEARMVLTTLRNRAMPFLRYDIEDVAVSAQGCDCGSSLPVFDRIVGRMYDYFRAADGSLAYGGYFTWILMRSPWVGRFQVIQEAIDEVTVSYIPRAPVDTAEQEVMTAQIRRALGESCRVTWRQVDEIPLTPQGKMLYVFSRVGGQYS